MGEAIITRGCYGGGDNGSTDVINMAPTEGIYTINGTYVCTRDGNYIVQCLGGGGGGSGVAYWGNGTGYTASYGAYGGNINNATVYLNRAEAVSITIGGGGYGGVATSSYGMKFAAGNTGGTTSFGTYLSATGGSGGNGGTFANASAASAKIVCYNNRYNDTSGVLYATANETSGLSMTSYGKGGASRYLSFYQQNTLGQANGINGNAGCITIRYLDW